MNNEAKTTVYLTYSLGDETFATPVTDVREILEMMSITHVPQAPAYVKGVLNIRGMVLPVIDLRLKLSLMADEENPKSRIIVFDVQKGKERLLIGCIVDAVTDVLEIAQDQIEPTPNLEDYKNSKYIDGMAKIDDHFIMLINIHKVFSEEEASDLANTTVKLEETN